MALQALGADAAATLRGLVADGNLVQNGAYWSATKDAAGQFTWLSGAESTQVAPPVLDIPPPPAPVVMPPPAASMAREREPGDDDDEPAPQTDGGTVALPWEDQEDGVEVAAHPVQVNTSVSESHGDLLAESQKQTAILEDIRRLLERALERKVEAPVETPTPKVEPQQVTSQAPSAPHPTLTPQWPIQQSVVAIPPPAADDPRETTTHGGASYPAPQPQVFSSPYPTYAPLMVAPDQPMGAPQGPVSAGLQASQYAPSAGLQFNQGAPQTPVASPYPGWAWDGRQWVRA